MELHTDARLWEVQWPELTIQRLLGRGSFGSVYLAEWSHTQVAVKVPASKGERCALCAHVPALLVCLLMQAGVICAPSPLLVACCLQMTSIAGSWSYLNPC